MGSRDQSEDHQQNDFSKIASCPTKLGEMLSSGIPVITNGGIGDIELYLDNKRKSGFLINIINKKKLKILIIIY